MNNALQRLFNAIQKSVLEIFPDTVAILHWGGAAQRKKLLPHGDIDILIVLQGDTVAKNEDVLKLKNLFNTQDLDPYVVSEKNLKQKTITATGPHGPCEMHELIHYQLKHESDVICGDKNIRRLIKPMDLDKALKEIVPHINKRMISPLIQKLENTPAEEFISQNLGILLVIARTVYSIGKHGIGTKEDALIYIAEQYPDLKRLSEFMLNRYMHKKTKPYPTLQKDIQKLLICGQGIFGCHLKARRKTPKKKYGLDRH